jgi:hypothetical protein
VTVEEVEDIVYVYVRGDNGFDGAFWNWRRSWCTAREPGGCVPALTGRGWNDGVVIHGAQPARRPDVHGSRCACGSGTATSSNIWKAEAVWPFVEPLLTLVALGFGLGDFIELDRQESYIEFIGPGILAAYAMWMASAEACWGAYFRMDQKTFDAILATPVSIDDITSGEVLWASTRSLISVAATSWWSWFSGRSIP